jgi:predicted amidohydrolase
MRIAAVQFRPSSGNLESNLQRHLALAAQASAEGADLACFPELSLTGYQTKRAAEWASIPEDSRLEALQQAARSLGIAIAVGVPLRAYGGVQVGMIVFQPHRPRVVYAKHLLHADEFPYFVPGRSQVVLEFGGRLVVPAICFESLQEEHARQAAALGADVYLASVAKSAQGELRACLDTPGKACWCSTPEDQAA